ncbi:FHA domain-containing protein [Salinibacterium sp. ZJ450]|uniref:FHA domain-containing protein n=1 Tax=Salinibacterium sp. ZJ450 TaxID=2708338 RepID=UPI00141E7BDE|nr:FHA domain-containing protein [Salinibacterium sp. ZJ450]
MSSPTPPAANPWAPPITTVPGIPLRQPAATTPPTPTPTPPLDDAHLDTEATIITGAATSVLAEDDEATRIVPRRTVWSLQTGAGQSITLTQDVVLLGRNPKPSFGPADAQLVKLEDPAKTVSQTHARLDRGPAGWSVTDLHSTNGVIVVGAEGDEREILPETSTELAERFQLGDLDLRLTTAR